jgi:hypothetical protein
LVKKVGVSIEEPTLYHLYGIGVGLFQTSPSVASNITQIVYVTGVGIVLVVLIKSVDVTDISVGCLLLANEAAL